MKYENLFSCEHSLRLLYPRRFQFHTNISLCRYNHSLTNHHIERHLNNALLPIRLYQNVYSWIAFGRNMIRSFSHIENLQWWISIFRQLNHIRKLIDIITAFTISTEYVPVVSAGIVDVVLMDVVVSGTSKISNKGSGYNSNICDFNGFPFN